MKSFASKLTTEKQSFIIRKRIKPSSERGGTIDH